MERHPEIKFYRLPREHIVELLFIMEGYDGMGVVRTLDRQRGIIEILLAPDYEQELNALIRDLGQEFPIEEIDKPPDVSSILDE